MKIEEFINKWVDDKNKRRKRRREIHKDLTSMNDNHSSPIDEIENTHNTTESPQLKVE